MELVLGVSGYEKLGGTECQIRKPSGQFAYRAVVQIGGVLQVRLDLNLRIHKEREGKCGKKKGAAGGPFHGRYSREIGFMRQLAKRFQRSFVKGFSAGLARRGHAVRPLFWGLSAQKQRIFRGVRAGFPCVDRGSVASRIDSH